MQNLLNKMKQNKDVSMKKNSNLLMWSEPMLRIAVKKGQLSISEFEKVTNTKFIKESASK